MRDESSALNGIAGNPLVSDPGRCRRQAESRSTASTSAAETSDVRAKHSRLRRRIRASVLGSGSLLADFYASDNNVDFSGGSVPPYDVSHVDKRYNEGLSWGRTFDGSEFAFGGYARQESLTGLGISETLSQSINSYFVRGAQQVGKNLRLSGGLYDANYSSFGNTLNWRLGASRRSRLVERRPLLGRHRVPRAAAHRALFLPARARERRPRSPIPACRRPTRTASSPDRAIRSRSPSTRPSTSSASRIFSPAQSNLDVSIYRSNLRDTIENYYPGLFVQGERPERFRVRDSDQHRQRRLRRRGNSLQAAVPASRTSS